MALSHLGWFCATLITDIFTWMLESSWASDSSASVELRARNPLRAFKYPSMRWRRYRARRCRRRPSTPPGYAAHFPIALVSQLRQLRWWGCRSRSSHMKVRERIIAHKIVKIIYVKWVSNGPAPPPTCKLMILIYYMHPSMKGKESNEGREGDRQLVNSQIKERLRPH